MTPTTALVFLSVLFPTKGWFGPNQYWTITVRPPQGTTVRLVMTDFSGSTLDAIPAKEREFDKEGAAELKRFFPAIKTGGCYLLYAIPRPAGADAEAKEDATRFLGTPLVITVREDRRPGAPDGPMAVKVEPLRYAILSTDAGDMTVGFYYDAAPNNIANFTTLASEGFYDGLTFHRVEPDFLIQGGDPRGDGTGGPGYNVDAEFSDRKHEYGVLSMSRNVDPNEAPNSPPRPEYANSAGSQFFIAAEDAPADLRKNTAQLDGVYTAFGRIVGDSSKAVLAALVKTPIADPKSARPAKPPVIKRIELRPVTARENPYRALQATNAQPPPGARPEREPSSETK